MEPTFLWPDLVLHITASLHAHGWVKLRFRGVERGRECLEFGHVDTPDPAARINELGRNLDKWTDETQTSDIDALWSHLEGIGYQLFRDLLPEKLQNYYWSKLHSAEGSTVLLVPEGAAVNFPWEIIRPANDGEEAPYWCEHLSVSRWLSSSPIVQSLPGQPIACVLADAGLDDVAEPAHTLLNVSSNQIIGSWEPLLNLLNSDGIGILHWTGHGEPCSDNPSLSGLPIAGETFRPVDILSPKRRRFFSKRPWIFLHACSTHRAAGSFVGLGGWPVDLIDAGAGAVLGTAWDVRTSTAVHFVTHLYRLILKGEPVGDAVRRARQQARMKGDPSWLAYQLYAHPAAHIIPTLSQGAGTQQPVKIILRRMFGTGTAEDLDWRQGYLRRIHDGSQHVDEAIVPLAGTTEIKDFLEFSTIYVEPQLGDEVVVRSFTDIVEAIAVYKAVVLLGGSGSGKTTTLHRIMRSLADDALSGEHGVPTPVLVTLDEYNLGEPPLNYLRACCGDSELHQRMETELAKKRLCILCDGLNELTRENYRKKIQAWRRFMQRYPGNLFVFACRSSSYQDELRLQKIEISPLDDERIVRALFTLVGDGANDLWQSLQSSELHELARMPLFLKWIVQSYCGSNGRLPRNRSLLVKGLVDSLVTREQETGAYENVLLDVVTLALAEVAFDIQLKPSDNGITRQHAGKILENRIAGEVTSADEVLDFAVSVGLLRECKGGLRFHNQRLQDYFCGVALARRFENGEKLTPYLGPNSGLTDEPTTAEMWQESTAEIWQELSPPLTTHWEEALVIASGLVVDGSGLLEAVCAVKPRLAGECLSRNAPIVKTQTADLVRNQILRVATDAATPLAERIASAVTLGQVGDPRFATRSSSSNVAYVASELISIPAGIVLLGSGDCDTLAFPDERPRHPMTVPSFRIGRYPVTNAEFHLFVRAGGYDKEAYWTKDGWLWRKTRDTGEGSLARRIRNLAYFRANVGEMEAWFESTGVPKSEREMWRSLLPLDHRAALAVLLERGYGMVRSRDRPAFQHSSRFGGENQPVIGVTWYEAAAYCCWLGEVSGNDIALPSEAQWERAAKGDNDWVYPWGSFWEPDRCNALSERVLRPSPVGIFPKGRSAFGCEDMVGNVFEWTISLYRPYPYHPSDGREEISGTEVRVTRGGGWDSMQRVTRCALRGDMCEPYAYDINLGFRVAAS